MSRDRTPRTLGLILLALLVFGEFLPQWMLFLMTVALAKGLVVLGLMILLRCGLEQHPLRQEFAENQQREQDQPERARRAVAAHIFLASAMLNSPRGLNASTIAITRKITNSSACGK